MDICNLFSALFGGYEIEEDVRRPHLQNEADAIEIVNILYRSEKAGKDLQLQLRSRISAESWSESFARSILDKLVEALQDPSRIMGQALKEAYDKAWEAAKEIPEFAHEHPMLCTVIALGILAILMPYVLGWLGFAAEGPVADSFAAWWQSTYGGCTPGGSLFSFLQKLGMIWH